MEVSKNWVTTPAVCDICGKKWQLVFETQIIIDGDQEQWKFPADITCDNFGSDKLTYTDFE